MYASLWLLFALATAETSLFVAPLRESEPVEDQRRDAIIAHYDVDIDVRSIARDALSADQVLAADLPSGRVAFRLKYFEPLSGFSLDRYGNVVLDPGVPPEDLRYSWYGVSEAGELLLGVYGNGVSGRIALRSELFALAAPHGTQVLRQLDPERLPPEADYLWSPGEESEPLPLEPVSKYFDHVSVLIYHTQGALDMAGGQVALDQHITEMIAGLQTALANSGVVQTGIVHLTPSGSLSLFVPYDQSPTELNAIIRYQRHRLHARTDPAIQAARNQHQADVIVLLEPPRLSWRLFGLSHAISATACSASCR